MLVHNFFNPGFFLMLAGLSLNFIAQKSYKISALLFMILSYLVLIINNFYWHEQFWLFDKQTSLILTSIFFLVLFISIIIAFCTKEKFLHYIPLLFIYVGGTVAILFTKNLLWILCLLEIMMIAAVFIIFLQKDKLSQTEGLNYFKFHMLGGTLLLIGIMGYYLRYNSFNIDLINKNNLYSLNAIFILTGLLVNLAVPPFSSWLLGGYATVPSYIGLVFAICTTKISALLVMKLFAGWDILIFIGIITSIYGILFSLFDNNIKRSILYVIIAELGIILIFIGVTQNTTNTSLIAIINDLICIPMLLCSTYFIIHFFKQEKITDIKNVFSNAKLVTFLTGMAALSIAAFPFTLGYISKQNLYTNSHFANVNWIPHIMDIISIGITIAVCFRFIVFVFFRNFSLKETTKNKVSSKEYNSYIFALILLFIGLLTTTIYFIVTSDKKTILFNGFFKAQIQHFLVAAVIFFILKKYLIYTRNIISIDPNILYLTISKNIYFQFINRIKYSSNIIGEIGYYLSNMHIVTSSLFKNKVYLTQRIGWTITLAIIIFFIILFPLK